MTNRRWNTLTTLGRAALCVVAGTASGCAAEAPGDGLSEVSFASTARPPECTTTEPCTFAIALFADEAAMPIEGSTTLDGDGDMPISLSFAPGTYYVHASVRANDGTPLYSLGTAPGPITEESVQFSFSGGPSTVTLWLNEVGAPPSTTEITPFGFRSIAAADSDGGDPYQVGASGHITFTVDVSDPAPMNTVELELNALGGVNCGTVGGVTGSNPFSVTWTASAVLGTSCTLRFTATEKDSAPMDVNTVMFDIDVAITNGGGSFQPGYNTSPTIDSVTVNPPQITIPDDGSTVDVTVDASDAQGQELVYGLRLTRSVRRPAPGGGFECLELSTATPDTAMGASTISAPSWVTCPETDPMDAEVTHVDYVVGDATVALEVTVVEAAPTDGSTVASPLSTSATLVLNVLELRASGPEVDAGALYATHCARCHGDMGMSVMGLGADFTALPRPARSEIVNTITNGRPGTIMLGFGDSLAEREIAALAEYVEGFYMDA